MIMHIACMFHMTQCFHSKGSATKATSLPALQGHNTVLSNEPAWPELRAVGGRHYWGMIIKAAEYSC